jgi:hypothetical protein
MCAGYLRLLPAIDDSDRKYAAPPQDSAHFPEFGVKEASISGDVAAHGLSVDTFFTTCGKS